ncbi:MAG: hypothetical protein Q4Q14_01005 [Methanobrevibacter sp.]|nr:hypothetical protein [Methanobrevibacter sp.]
MDKNIKKVIQTAFDFNEIVEYSFRKLHGFTFAFKSEFVFRKGNITSASITPVGIIYEENDEFYLAPLYDDVEIDEIIRNYVEEEII